MQGSIRRTAVLQIIGGAVLGLAMLALVPVSAADHGLDYPLARCCWLWSMFILDGLPGPTRALQRTTGRLEYI